MARKTETADASPDLDQAAYNRVAEYNAESLRLIQEAEAWANQAAMHALETADVAKQAKKTYETALDDIRIVIRERQRGIDEVKRGQKLLPFAGATEADAEHREAKADIDAAFRPGDDQADDEPEPTGYPKPPGTPLTPAPKPKRSRKAKAAAEVSA